MPKMATTRSPGVLADDSYKGAVSTNIHLTEEQFEELVRLGLAQFEEIKKQGLERTHGVQLWSIGKHNRRVQVGIIK